MSMTLSGRQKTKVFALGVGTLLIGGLFFGHPAQAQEQGPAPANTGANVPLTYFGPMPAEVEKSLVGPVKLLKAGKVDEKAGTVQLPLYQGRMKDGKKVWYVLTDTTDKANADALGLNFSSKLSYANVGKACRTATLGTDAALVFDSGTVDFAPEHKLVPGEGAHAFPPKMVQPGSMGDKNYTPLVRIMNAGNHIYNAPVIAYDVDADKISFPNGNVNHAILHDKVVKCDPANMTVTLKLSRGFSVGRPILYLSFESNDMVGATLEESTYAPALSDLHIGGDDSAFSPVERIFIFANGPTDLKNPQHQGLDSAISDKTDPMNIFGGIPTLTLDYSPMWDANIGEWTPEAVSKGYRSRMIDEFQTLDMVRLGWIKGPGGKTYGSSGIIINCPIVMRLL